MVNAETAITISAASQSWPYDGAAHSNSTVTVTEGELLLRWAGSAMKMKAGETCLLAKNSPELSVEGIGTAALAMPS